MSNESGTGVYVYQQIVKTTAEWEADIYAARTARL